MSKMLVQYLRLERESTGSFMTYKLFSPTGFVLAEHIVKQNLPGWDLIHGCIENPDDEDFVAWEESSWKN